MLIRIPPQHPILSSQITPEDVWRQRRRFMAGGLGAAAWLAAGAPRAAEQGSKLAALSIATRRDHAGGESPTPFEAASTYNNYYEFGTDKDEPSRHAHTLRTRPWEIAVEGECEAPGRIGIEELVSAKNLEERIYRFRCVETWSMVVPWVGVPLASVIARFKPTSRARYVAFETLYDRKQMPLSRSSGLTLPYVEGLRMDEALHPLTLLTVGMYGRVLPNQNGAPVRLVVPWKYGYKSIKSVVRMRFVEEQPPTTWNRMAPHEYGFYSNVNPERSHPRWSQVSERRLGELFKRKTLPFNGYAQEVAALYAGMNLRKLH